ncbi:methylosome protein WDR77-like [Liolophura sinensis]|uniref:methylosome protein WDR77-like n=1 Tax=Liolophura sinensis TaxID=3198878 RepID=UPI0031595BD2
MDQIPAAMDRHLDVLQSHKDGGILLGASSLTGRYWLGSIWFYENPDLAPDVEKCTAGVQLEAGISDLQWVDDTRVLVALDTGGIELWHLVDNFHTFTHLQTATEHDDVVSTVSVSCDKKRAASGSYDRCIKVWDLASNKSVHSYRGHADMVSVVAYSHSQPDVFISCSQDDNLLLWDTRKPRPARQIDKRCLEACPTCVCWKPDNDYTLGVGSEMGELCVLDTRKDSDKPLYGTPHRRAVHRLQFSTHSPSLLASVSDDSSVALSQIDSSSFKLLYKDTEHQDFVRGVCWVSTVKVYTCGWDSAVKRHLVEMDVTRHTPDQKEPVIMEVNGEKRDSTTPDMDMPHKNCSNKVTEADQGTPVPVASS